MPNIFDQFKSLVGEQLEKAKQDQDTLQVAARQAADVVAAPPATVAEGMEALNTPESAQVAENSLAVAGSLSPVPGILPKAEAITGVAKGGFSSSLAQAKSLVDEVAAGIETGLFSQADLVAATQRYNAALDKAARHTSQVAARKMPKKFAEGGMVEAEPEGLDRFLLSDQHKKITLSPNHNNEPEGLDDFISAELREEQYGGLGQQTLAALEGGASAATFGLSTGLQTALGADPEAIRQRAEENPLARAVGAGAGLIASSFIPGVGAANLISKGGAAAAGAVGLGKVAGGSFVRQVGADAVKGAFEAALLQGGEEISKAFTNDPKQSAETAMADIGLASVMGGVFGGAAGAALRKLGAVKDAVDSPGTFVSELDRPALDAGEFQASIVHSDTLSTKDKAKILFGLSEEKPDAATIREAGQRIGAPVLEGMTSASKLVQQAEDSLINGVPTLSGMRRRGLYEQGYKAAAGTVDNALGDGSKYTKAELGNIFKSSLKSQISEENAPITAIYGRLKEMSDAVPVGKDLFSGLESQLKNIPEIRVSPNSPSGQMAKRLLNDLENVKTVDDLKVLKSSLWDNLPPTAPAGEKRMASVLSDMLGNLEEKSIINAAKGSLNPVEFGTWQAEKEAASRAYKPFINKVKTLSEQLGKGRVYGVKDALNFLDDLTPEEVTQKLFAKNNSEFLKFFAKEFPEQHALMQEYQKGVLREMASGAGDLSPKVLFNKLNKMEPEILKSVFTADELAKLKDAETYLRAFPKNFNPSGTSGMSAFRSFFESPTGALIGNARDLGIEAFIKMSAKAPEMADASYLGKATVKAAQTTQKAIKAILDPDKVVMPVALAANIASRDKIKRMVEEYSTDPSQMLDKGASNPVPEYNQAFAESMARAVSYLATLKPNTTPANPLDAPPVPNAVEVAKYNRAVDLAQQPLLILKHIKDGTLLESDIAAVRTIYPALYQGLVQKLTDQVIEAKSKGRLIPYNVRLGISQFIGQPLDSTMTATSIMSSQPKPPETPQPGAGKPPSASSMKGLQKMPQTYQTSTQTREQRAQRD
jgi:hypothetical protein